MPPKILLYKEIKKIRIVENNGRCKYYNDCTTIKNRIKERSGMEDLEYSRWVFSRRNRKGYFLYSEKYKVVVQIFIGPMRKNKFFFETLCKREHYHYYHCEIQESLVMEQTIFEDIMNGKIAICSE